MSEKLSLKSLFLVIGIIFVSIVLFFLTIVVFIAYFHYGHTEYSSKSYIYSEFNPFTNETVRDFVSLSKLLKSEEFVTYRKPTNHFVTISNIIFSDEYECVGNCFCKNEKSRNRRTTIALQKSMYFLVFAISSIVAIRISENYFNEECISMFSKICDGEVKSETEDCKIKVAEAMPVEEITYYCTGNCVFNPSKALRKKIPKRMRKTSIVNFNSFCSVEKLQMGVDVPPAPGKKYEKELAESLFRRNFMKGVCDGYNKRLQNEYKFVKEGMRYCTEGTKEDKNIECYKG